MTELVVRGGKNLIGKNYVFKKVQGFRYLRVTSTDNNGWNAEIVNRLPKAKRAFFALIKCFKPKLLSRGIKICLYMTIVRPTLTYGYEV